MREKFGARDVAMGMEKDFVPSFPCCGDGRVGLSARRRLKLGRGNMIIAAQARNLNAQSGIAIKIVTKFKDPRRVVRFDAVSLEIFA